MQNVIIMLLKIYRYFELQNEISHWLLPGTRSKQLWNRVSYWVLLC